MTYVDTSVPGRLLVEDPTSSAVRELFAAPRSPLTSSSLIVAELLRVATRLEQEQGPAERLLRRVKKLTVDDSVLRQAGRLVTPGTWVRAADAIHLVSAMHLLQDEFLTYDRVQARGAESLGMTVRSPGLADGWWRS